ncbi:GNAT family N-acetyltransferase [Pelistega sp. NLN82]|uniref:GNAT family N-acetyltransferase n=1 Tax=Pelistega ratti TaxID=2652177 RepID=A0A6L9Y8G8_9BURK|nr:GNAT family N-acetyltransferase [Pelistega ratti]NEN76128.1 GNAT family N-acetyltransferase [Pelistega ratti]
MAYSFVELSSSINRKDFLSRSKELNEYFKQFASQDQKRGLAKCYVLISDKNETVGYYTISASSVLLTSFPKIVQKRVSYKVLPVALIGRLAIDKKFEGKGFGSILIYDAIERVKKNVLAVAAVIVTAKDNKASNFYKHLGFIPFDSLINDKETLFYPLSKVFNTI